MKGQVRFVKTTVIGGIVFLVPIIIIIAIVGKAFEIMKKVADPLSALLPIDSVGDIAIVNLLALALIVLVCFAAGLVARARFAGKFIGILEDKILSHIPMYAFIKGMSKSLAGAEGESDLTPVLVRLDDYSQFAFEIERLEDGNVVVYLPGAPNPWSGSVCIMTADRVQYLDDTMVNTIQNIRHLGKGSGALLRRP